MDVIYEQAVDQHVASRLLYENAGILYEDANCTTMAKTTDVKKAFILGVIILEAVSGAYYKPISYSEADGVATLAFTNGTTSGSAISTPDVNPLERLFVDSYIAEDTDLLGKVVGDLQSNVVIGEDSITGTLKYVSGYTGFSGIESEQSGNYIAFHSSVPGVPDATITVKKGNKAPVTLDPDGIIILIIEDKDDPVTVTASKTGYNSVSKTFSLKDVVCEAAE